MLSSGKKLQLIKLKLPICKDS